MLTTGKSECQALEDLASCEVERITSIRELRQEKEARRCDRSLLARLLPFAEHSPHCRVSWSMEPVCTCGLEALSEEVKEILNADK